MPYKLFDYVDASGLNEFREWTRSLELEQLGRLNAKIDMLEKEGSNLGANTLSDCGRPGLKKLKVRGNVQLRPLLCHGPADFDGEFTFLFGAIEVQSEWRPRNALNEAELRKQFVTAEPRIRRVAHERVTWKSKGGVR